MIDEPIFLPAVPNHESRIDRFMNNQELGLRLSTL